MRWERLVPSSGHPEPQWSNVHRWRMQRWIHGVQVDTGLDTTLLCTLCPRSYDIRDGYMNFVSIYRKFIERKRNHTHQHHPPIDNPQLGTEILHPPRPNKMNTHQPRRQHKVKVQVDTCGTPRWIQSYTPQPPVEAERNATRA